MRDDLNIVSPGIDAAGVYRMQNSDRALIANNFYGLATGVKNRAGQFVGFALTDDQLSQLLNFKSVKGREIARAFFNQYAQPTGAVEVGRFLLVGIELDMFLDLLAGLPVNKNYQKPGEIVTPHGAVPAKEINTKKEGERW